jgi:hypothetical protein
LHLASFWAANLEARMQGRLLQEQQLQAVQDGTQQTVLAEAAAVQQQRSCRSLQHGWFQQFLQVL